MGQIAALDADAQTITLKTLNSGDSATYALTQKTHCWRNKRAAEATDFKAGEAVVLHIRSSSTGDLPKVTEMADPTTWNWLRKMQRETTVGTLREIGEQSVTVTVGTEAIPLTYTFSDKTHWSKGGQEVGPDRFKTGDTVAVVPRALPGGGIGARVIADSVSAAEQAKEMLSRTVSGIVQSVDPAGHSLTLQTQAGALRTLTCAATVLLQDGTKTLPFDHLRPGLPVHVHLKSDTDGNKMAVRIQIATVHRRASRTGKTGAATKPSKPRRTGSMTGN
ncbi:MAG TPA: hypothetical protein VKU00_31095 [Chthonomonadaceae bacterium]|nr:hypothetical protein [Chthonomonadaceae bacterium]